MVYWLEIRQIQLDDWAGRCLVLRITPSTPINTNLRVLALFDNDVLALEAHKGSALHSLKGLEYLL